MSNEKLWWLMEDHLRERISLLKRDAVGLSLTPDVPTPVGRAATQLYADEAAEVQRMIVATSTSSTAAYAETDLPPTMRADWQQAVHAIRVLQALYGG